MLGAATAGPNLPPGPLVAGPLIALSTVAGAPLQAPFDKGKPLPIVERGVLGAAVLMRAASVFAEDSPSGSSFSPAPKCTDFRRTDAILCATEARSVSLTSPVEGLGFRL